MILAKTVKGYGLGEAGEGSNITHQQKKLNEEELAYLSKRFDLNLSPTKPSTTSDFYRPPEDSPEMKYLHERRESLGGYLPVRACQSRSNIKAPPLELFAESLDGSRGREASTTHGVRRDSEDRC